MTNHELGRPLACDQLTSEVPEAWREQFVSFVTRGVASEEFLKFLDEDEATQRAVESALADEVRKFNDFVTSLHIDADVLAAYAGNATGSPAATLGRQALTRIFSDLLTFFAHQPRDQREPLLGAIAASCAADKRDVSGVLEQLRSKLDRERQNETESQMGLQRR